MTEPGSTDPTDRPAQPVGQAVSERRRRGATTLAVVVVLVGLGLFGLSLVLDQAPACDPIPGVRPGVCITDPASRGAAPTDTAPLVGGGEASVADFRGQVLVVNFWAAWCGPCRAEQPVLNDAHDALAGDDVAFLGVAIQDSMVNQQAHLDEFDVAYPSIFDQSNAYSARYGGIGARSIPTTIFLDRQGRVAARVFGEVLDAQEVAAIAVRLAEEADAGV